MGVLKRILKSDGVRRVLCWLGARYILFVHLTGRWTYINRDIPQAFWDRDEPFVLALWHGRFLLMSNAWPSSKPVHMLISQHRDGQLIARTIGHLGIGTVAGSSSRGGASALRAMVKLLKRGDYIGITPDGPRGPRMHASEGVAAVARLAGVPVIPASYSTNRRKVVNSWDRFIVAWPFSKGVFIWGEPIHVGKDDDLGAARERIESAINAVTAEADRLTGHPPVEPAVIDPDVMEPSS